MVDEKEGLFANKTPNPDEHVNKHGHDESHLVGMNAKLNDIATRLKILEERQVTLRKKLQLTEHNIIELEKESFQELQLVSKDILELKKILNDLAEKISLLSDEVSNFVDSKEFTILERYLSFWEPMDFVTRKEVNDFLRKKYKEENKQ
jgi:3-methyladenine DNA glycosylase AlkD